MTGWRSKKFAHYGMQSIEPAARTFESSSVPREQSHRWKVTNSSICAKDGAAMRSAVRLVTNWIDREFMVGFTAMFAADRPRAMLHCGVNPSQVSAVEFSTGCPGLRDSTLLRWFP